MYDTTENCEDSVMRFHAVLKFKEFIPERMRQEVQSYAGGSSFE